MAGAAVRERCLGRRWGEARDPHATVSAQPPARTPTWPKSAPRIANGPRFAAPGAGQIFKEQMHAPSIQAWLNFSALYTHIIRKNVSTHLHAARILRRKPKRLRRFRFPLRPYLRIRLHWCRSLLPRETNMLRTAGELGVRPEIPGIAFCRTATFSRCHPLDRRDVQIAADHD